jgi:hypothetical protein
MGDGVFRADGDAVSASVATFREDYRNCRRGVYRSGKAKNAGRTFIYAGAAEGAPGGVDGDHRHPTIF